MLDGSIYLECNCSQVAHIIRLTKDCDANFIYVEIHLIKLPLRKRIWKAIKYILGGDIPWGHYEETILNTDEIEKLRVFLENFLNEIRTGTKTNLEK